MPFAPAAKVRCGEYRFEPKLRRRTAPEERTFDRESLVAMAVIAVSVELLEPYPVAAQATLS